MMLKRPLSFCALFAFCGNATFGQCPGLAFAHLVDGSGWKSSIYLINSSPSTKANYTLTFRGDSGQPVLLSFTDGRRDNQISGTIAGGGVAILETPGSDSDPLSVASATLNVTGGVSGFGVIRERQAGGPDREATIALASPAAGGLVFPFDNTSGFASSIALAVPCGPDSEIHLTAAALDETGAPLGRSILNVKGGGHLAFMIADQLPGAKGKRGIIRVTAPTAPGGNVYLAGVGLRFTPSGALTTFPPSPWTPAGAAHITVRPSRSKRAK
jgi:hypothetical protein